MQTHEKIFNPEYFYNGINNIQFNINNPPKVFLKHFSRVMSGVLFVGIN
jgi:hypothetical protein